MFRTMGTTLSIVEFGDVDWDGAIDLVMQIVAVYTTKTDVGEQSYARSFLGIWSTKQINHAEIRALRFKNVSQTKLTVTNLDADKEDEILLQELAPLDFDNSINLLYAINGDGSKVASFQRFIERYDFAPGIFVKDIDGDGKQEIGVTSEQGGRLNI